MLRRLSPVDVFWCLSLCLNVRASHHGIIVRIRR
jgi:hypothetical protein